MKRFLLFISCIQVFAVSAQSHSFKTYCHLNVTDTTSFFCLNSCTGIAILRVSGGTPPYNWPSGTSTKTSDTMKNLCGGNYSYPISDSKGCTDTVIVSFEYYPNIYLTYTAPSCDTCCDGTASVHVITSASSFNWSPPPKTGPYGTTINACAGVTYTCCAVNAAGCVTCDSINVPVPTSVKEISQPSVDFSVFPNPAKEHFSVNISNAGKRPYTLQVYNILGQPVYKEEFTPSANKLNKAIDLVGKPAGVYMVVIKNDATTITKRIVMF
ncbi:MAG TPA: T9SS type A sorting domain-containing protein [Bacteroidia bacterium]|jgi:hypothetical protein|nr:T9SS type A sorting domain-containing protein [Bacteroidia bacterium]